jgi:hypothetical protein
MCLTSRIWISRLVLFFIGWNHPFSISIKKKKKNNKGFKPYKNALWIGIETTEFNQPKRDQPWNPTPWSSAHVKAEILLPCLAKLHFESGIFKCVWPPLDSWLWKIIRRINPTPYYVSWILQPRNCVSGNLLWCNALLFVSCFRPCHYIMSHNHKESRFHHFQD